MENKQLKNISFIMYNFSKGGLERVVNDLLHDLVKHYTVSIHTFGGGNETYAYQIPKEVIVFKNEKANYKDGINQLINSNSNLIVSFLYLDQCIHDFLFSLPSSSLPKIIISFHTSFFRINPLIRKKLIRHAQKAAYITVLTRFSKVAFDNYLSNTIHLPNASSYNITKTTNRENQNIICIGDFTRDYGYIKRLDRAIKTFATIKKKIPTATLTVVGKYDLSIKINRHSLSELITNSRLIINQDIFFTGVVDCIQDYYKRASLFLLTSTFEGFPMVLLEAMSFGVPVVINKINGLEDLIKNNKNGFIVNQNHNEEMAKKCIQLLTNETLYEKIQNNAYQTLSDYSPETIHGEWKTLIDSTIKHKTLTNTNTNIDINTYYELFKESEKYYNTWLSDFENDKYYRFGKLSPVNKVKNIIPFLLNKF